MPGTRFTPELVDKLLDKLSTDDKFRKEFERDPHAALVTLGASPSFEVGGCLKPKHLAAKEVIHRTRAKIRDVLLGTESHEIFCLEAR